MTIPTIEQNERYPIRYKGGKADKRFRGAHWRRGGVTWVSGEDMEACLRHTSVFELARDEMNKAPGLRAWGRIELKPESIGADADAAAVAGGFMAVVMIGAHSYGVPSLQAGGRTLAMSLVANINNNPNAIVTAMADIDSVWIFAKEPGVDGNRIAITVDPVYGISEMGSTLIGGMESSKTTAIQLSIPVDVLNKHRSLTLPTAFDVVTNVTVNQLLDNGELLAPKCRIALVEPVGLVTIELPKPLAKHDETDSVINVLIWGR